MSGIVFISYRRSDAEGYAGRLYDRLEPKLTHEKLFMDVDSIGAGKDFTRVMREKVAESDVVLAIIGRGWSQATDDQGRRRLDDPGDPVRIELETALAADKIIIPVLCGPVDMPKPETLPETLKPLSTRHALRVANDRFRGDMATLEVALDTALAEAETRRTAELERRAREAEEAERARLEEAARLAAEEAERKRAAELAERKKAERARLTREAEQARRRAEELERLLASDDDGSAAASPPMSLLDDQVIKAEELANWDFVKSRGKIVELREHLQRWPLGVTQRMASATLEKLEWAALGAVPDEAALKGFLEAFPNGEHEMEAKRELAAIDEMRRKAEADRARLKQAFGPEASTGAKQYAPSRYTEPDTWTVGPAKRLMQQDAGRTEVNKQTIRILVIFGCVMLALFLFASFIGAISLGR